jgi:pimeloyl-ACP methyl ester carboxylesterase
MQWQKKHLANPPNSAQFYYVYGSGGTTLLLLHGFAETAEIFEDILPMLAEQYTVILPNLPGSNHTPCIQHCSIDALASFCHEVVLQETNEPYILMGHSLGGYISLRYLELYNNEVLGLGLINSHCFADRSDKIVKRKQTIAIANNGGSAAALHTLVHSIYSDQFLAASPGKIEEHVQYALTQNQTAVAYYNQAMMHRTDTSHILKFSKVPVLFVVGKQDNTCPLQQLLAQCAYPSVGQIEILDNCGHQSMREYPRELAKAIIAFGELVAHQGQPSR